MFKKKRGRGRPPELPQPKLPIPATPEELAQAIMQTPPKKRWRYNDEQQRRKAGEVAEA